MARVSAGTAPRGAKDEEQAAAWVQQMFSHIAPKYDLLNHILSFNIDRGWRKVLIKGLKPILDRPNTKILDLCCGTGDVMLDLQAAARGMVLAADFCHPMLVAAARKSAQKEYAAQLFEADALTLPLADGSLDAISIAFGFRNLTNYRAGIEELRRVLKPGGTLAILEFSHPPAPLLKATYGFYSRIVLPLVGSIVSGSREAYSYLPASIAKFPHAEELRQMMERAGFVSASYQLLSGGIAALHTGVKAD